MCLHDLPALSVIKLHPVILAVFNFAGALQRLREQFAQVVVVWGVFKAKVADITQVLVKLLCELLVHAHGCDQAIHEPGNPSHRSLIGVVCFFSPIFSYFCLFVAALRPCQGSPPRRKYMNTCPRASKSSRRDCSLPR